MASNLPLQGSLCMENVTFSGNNFGSVAIDGIKVHHLDHSNLSGK